MIDIARGILCRTGRTTTRTRSRHRRARRIFDYSTWLTLPHRGCMHALNDPCNGIQGYAAAIEPPGI